MNREAVENLVKNGKLRGQAINPKVTETHISWVLFSRDYALKIKKPEKLSFLDFSSLEKRKYYCEEELRLNSRLASVYLQVLPVIEQSGQLYVPQAKTQKGIDNKLKQNAQENPVVDYGVLMEKLPADRKMDNLLSQNKVSNSDIDKIATTLADFHQSAMVVKPELNLDHLKEKFNDISQSVDWVEKQLGSKWADIINRAITYNEGFLENHESRLKERIKNSFTRDVHGDLHSKNIFILKEPVIFDCIEFNEELRQIDLLDELAFFCMDLEAHHYNDLSGHFLQVYRKKSEVFFQPEDHAIFTYYRCYRANVRAKVMIIKARQPGSEENERNALLHDFKLYLKLIDGYLKEALPPF